MLSEIFFFPFLIDIDFFFYDLFGSGSWIRACFFTGNVEFIPFL